MQGIADGVACQGVSHDLEDIILLNTMYDQWCFYAHPHHSTLYGYKKNGDESTKTGQHKINGAGCSSFSAWGDAVYGENFVFGKNMDNLNLPKLLDNRILTIVDPCEGYGHAYVTHPGIIGVDGGFNEEGLCMMTQYNASVFETMEGCGIGIFTRLILSHAKKNDEAIKILSNFPRCTGIAYHVACTEDMSAVVVEADAKRVCIRYPQSGSNVLWTSNHSNCYPGWMGYNGYNMVKDQAKVYELDDVSCIAKWQESLRYSENLSVPAPSRFERYQELFEKHYGEISVKIAMDFLTDHYDPYTKKKRPEHLPSVSNNIMASICAEYSDDHFAKNDPLRQFKAHVANLWSMLITPLNGDFWLAVKKFPAQYGGYEQLNIKEELRLLSVHK